MFSLQVLTPLYRLQRDTLVPVSVVIVTACICTYKEVFNTQYIHFTTGINYPIPYLLTQTT